MTIILWLIFCVLVAAYANSKGRSGIGFFLLSLFVSPIIGGLIASVVEPDQGILDWRAVRSGKMVKCKYCAELIKIEARQCKYCGCIVD